MLCYLYRSPMLFINFLARSFLGSLGKVSLGVIYKIDALMSSLYSLAFGLAFQIRGCSVHHSCRFLGRNHISIGQRFIARRGLWAEAIVSYSGQAFTPQLTIGDDFCISENSHIACCSRLSIGHAVLVGSGVLITDHHHGIYSADYRFASSPLEPPASRALSVLPVSIGNNVFIGDGARILPGSSIEDGAIIGANSVVTGHVARNSIYAGAPASLLKFYDSHSLAWFSASRLKT